MRKVIDIIKNFWTYSKPATQLKNFGMTLGAMAGERLVGETAFRRTHQAGDRQSLSCRNRAADPQVTFLDLHQGGGGQAGTVRQARTVSHDESRGGNTQLVQLLFDCGGRPGRTVVVTGGVGEQSSELFGERVIRVPQSECHDFRERRGLHRGDGMQTGRHACGDRRTVDRDPLFGQPLDECHRRIRRRCHRQHRITGEQVGIMLLVSRPLAAAVHSHRGDGRVIHIAWIILRDSCRIPRIGEHRVVVAHGNRRYSTLSQRCRRCLRQCPQSGATVDMVRIIIPRAEQHIAAAFEIQGRSLPAGLGQIRARGERGTHIQHGCGGQRGQGFHGGCRFTLGIRFMAGDDCAVSSGDRDGKISAHTGIGGERVNKLLGGSGVNGFRPVGCPGNRGRGTGGQRRRIRRVGDIVQGQYTREHVRQIPDGIADNQQGGQGR